MKKQIIKININELYNNIKNKDKEQEKLVKELIEKENKASKIDFLGIIEGDKYILTQKLDCEDYIYSLIQTKENANIEELQDNFLSIIDDYVHSRWKLGFVNFKEKCFKITIFNQPV
nr:hypothetical protein [uncultured Tyzzerella sp.]